MKKTQDIIDRLLSTVWLYDKIFWKNTDLFLYEREREEEKNLLKRVFNYTDIDELFAEKIDDKRVTKMTKIFFTFAWEEEKRSLFAKKE